MSQIKTICVFCSASSHVDQIYKDAAQELGLLFAAHDLKLVYGGTSIGLMSILADTALERGVHVTGVIPEHLTAHEPAHAHLNQLHVTQTMQERQKLMSELSDAFVVLPGGLGTLAEFFEVVTWKQLGLHDKPIVVVNKNDYWKLLIATLDNVAGQGFLHGDLAQLFQVVNDVAEVPEALSIRA